MLISSYLLLGSRYLLLILHVTVCLLLISFYLQHVTLSYCLLIITWSLLHCFNQIPTDYLYYFPFFCTIDQIFALLLCEIHLENDWCFSWIEIPFMVFFKTEKSLKVWCYHRPLLTASEKYLYSRRVDL